MKRLVLGVPFIVESKDKVRLCIDTLRETEVFPLFFEFDKKFKSYLCTETIDPFLTAILPYAMEFGFDVECKAPISDEIYFNFTSDVIPVLSSFQNYFQTIQIIAAGGIVDRKVLSSEAVGTGVSCGVDSLYTILSHLRKYEKALPKSHVLTHLVLMNAGSCSGKGGEESFKWFSEEVIQAQKVCRELNLDLITIHTNLMEFYGIDHAHSGTMRMAGGILALDKLFGKYYLASGKEIEYFHFEENDAAYAFYTLRYTSTSHLQFYLTGNSTSRDKRIEYICESSIAQKYLNVCWNGFHNCGRCEKCLRTMGSLYSIGKLSLFSDSFDIGDFNKHKAARIAKMIYHCKQRPAMYVFLKSIRRNEYKLYLAAKLK